MPVRKRRQLLTPFSPFVSRAAGLSVLPSGMSPSSVPVSFSSWSVAYEDGSEGAF